MVKTIDKHIKEAFKKYGFSEEEIRNGCWILERAGKKIAWIALHKFLERVAIKAKISFNEPKVFENENRKIAILVTGNLKERSEWSIGETSPSNYRALNSEKMDAYPWAMAEKRGKDRVILKLLGIAGDMYSEEEADAFKKEKPKTYKEKLKETSDAFNERNIELSQEQEEERERLCKEFSKELNACESSDTLIIYWKSIQRDLTKFKARRKNLLVSLKDTLKEQFNNN